MSALSPLESGALALLVFFAGVVDSLAGGGGLITLPAYLAFGLPPALVLGTNKLASSIGTVVSTVRYSRRLRLGAAEVAPAVAVSLAGAWLGARLAVRIDPSWLRWMMLGAIPAVAWMVWSHHRFGTRDESGSLPPGGLALRSSAVAFPLGVYDGFFGPGTGTFLALGFARACRHDLLRATGMAKVLNLASNLAALAAFLSAGRVDVRLGATMGAASVAGHWVGASLGLGGGARVIRPVILLVLAGLFMKIALDLF